MAIVWSREGEGEAVGTVETVAPQKEGRKEERKGKFTTDQSLSMLEMHMSYR
jgi:hypothetical protein